MLPPVADAVAPPSDNPLHVTLLSTTAEADNTDGSVTVALLVDVQPLLSVTVTVYVPALTPLIDAVVAALLQE